MKYILVLLLMFLTLLLEAQVGQASFAFTRIPISPLSASLGGSQVATFRGDVAQIADNPAFIDSAMNGAINMAYLNYLSTINQASVSYAHQFDSIGFGSVYLRYLDYGTFQETDESGFDLGEFKAVDYELGVSFARSFTKNITYGATLKQVFSNMYRYFAYGVAVDLGGWYRAPSGNFAAGVTIDNVGVKLVDYTGTSNEMFPWSINAAVVKKFDEAPLAFGLQYRDMQRWDLANADLDALQNVNTDPLTGEQTRPIYTLDNLARHLQASVSFIPSEKFNLMLGYDFRRRLELASNQRPALVGFSFGAMVRVKKFGIQYAVSSYHLNGSSNHFAITTNLNEWYSKRSM